MPKMPPPRMPIQDEPESTIGRKPGELHEEHQPQPRGAARSGAAIRREEGDETEAGSEIRDREPDEPPSVPGLAE
jgi:hypothetical protein